MLIIGCGYVGRRIAGLLPTATQRVTGCVRSAESAAALRAAGIGVLQADLDAALDPAAVRDVDDLYYLAPPPRSGDVDTRMTHVLQALDGNRLRRMVYISTSAVYGDCQGAWITEAQQPAPNSGRGRRRLDAETQLINWCSSQGVQWTVLRVPGIYGPGKLPLARLEQGLPVLRESDAPYTNRIHGDDLAMICVSAMQSVACNTVFNVSDGHPSNMTDYFFRVADAAGLPRPPTVTRAEAEQVLSPGMLSFLADSRRMKNDKLLEQLGIRLQYPDLGSGLASCFTG